MTAGRGVTHTERTPMFRRTTKEFVMHGYQIWVALPMRMEEIDPQFSFYSRTDIPQWHTDSLPLKLVAGNAFGKSAPLQGYSPLFIVDIFAEKATTLKLKRQINGEVAFVIVKGSIIDEDQKVVAEQMLISKTNDECEICIEENTQLLLFGGEALPQEHFLPWNFVSHDKKRLKKAKRELAEKKFPKVPGDGSYIPIPDYL
ncbi:MAG: redox-sensitive bicupin YhaK (pirin superfamily) [Saprospiraceae bacterium]|jgi:redox-sensitive bicupin YhaK (pirin superfamily)